MRGIFVFLADGFEPLEALAPVDVLNRGKQNVRFVSLNGNLPVKSSQGYCLLSDLTWAEFMANLDESAADGCMIFPGGLPGADNLGDNAELMGILRRHFQAGGLVAAICAAPARVLARNLQGMAEGRRMTCYEGFENELEASGIIATGESVTVDGNLITGKGPGLAIDFGLAILSEICDHRIHKVVKNAMML